MKILNIITTGFAFNGGLSTVSLNYYKYLPKDKFLVDFASTNEIEQELLSYLSENNSSYFYLNNRKRKLIKYFFSLVKLLKKNKYDIVHIHGNSATMFIELFAAIISGIKCRIVHVHTTQSEYPILHKMLYPFFIRSYTVAIAVSKKAGDWLYKNRQYYILNNAIDLNDYEYNTISRKKIRKKYDIDNNFVIGNVGKFTDSKNHIFLLKVFQEYHKKHPMSKLLLVGDGDQRENLEKFIERNNLESSVIMIGLVDDTTEYYQAMDYFIFPSKYEGLGLAVIEAQASGLMCIASNNVPRETELTSSIIYMNIDINVSEWVKEIEKTSDYNREENSKKNVRDISERGYAIEMEVDKLIDIYQNFKEK